MRRSLFILLAEVVALLIIHAASIRLLANSNAVATIFAAGDHVPRWPMACAVGFLLIRLLTVLFLPGLILYRLGLIIVTNFLKHDSKKGA